VLRAAVTGAAGTLAATAVWAEDNSLPIVDTHQHLWDLKQFRLPWLDHAGDVLNRTYTAEDYLRAAAGLNVVKAVYMEVDVEQKQRAEEADYVVGLCRQKSGPTVAAVIGGAADSDEFAKWVGRFKDSPYVKGVRSSFNAGLAAEPAFVKNLRMLGGLGLCFDINTGPSELRRAAAVAAQCPETRFVVDHCGNIDAAVYRRRGAPADAAQTRTQWEKGIAALAERQNVVCKISGVMEAAQSGNAGDEEYAAAINHCIACFGRDRVMFASNWPVLNRAATFSKWVQLLRSVTSRLPDHDVRKLFGDNAIAFYGL
jgi:predicted TIM-barrel fold metal-dependent hydrolase